MKNLAAIRSEAALIKSAQSGDSEAFAALVARHKTQIYRVSLRILKNQEDAEDNLQNTMLKAFCQIRRFNRESQFSSWLVRIAINEALMFLRRQRSRKMQDTVQITEDGDALVMELPDPSSNPEREYIHKELASKVMFELGPKLEKIVLLQKLEGWTSHELAEQFGISAGLVKYRLFRARAILREKMELLTQVPSAPVL